MHKVPYRDGQLKHGFLLSIAVHVRMSFYTGMHIQAWFPALGVAVHACAQGTLTFLAPINKLTFVTSTIRPDFFAHTVLLILDPFSLIYCTVRVDIASNSMGFVIKPLAFIYITICVDEFALAISFVS